VKLLLLLIAMALSSQPARTRTFDQVAAMPSRAADHRDAYGQAPEQFGELRLPKGTGPHPVVVLIHGGCWRSAYDVSHVAPLATALTAEGYAVWAIEYRRVGSPGGGWPNTFLDVGAGIDHLRTLVSQYSLDLSRVVAMGHSAGGQLALWSGTRGSAPAGTALAVANPLMPTGVVSLAGITDLAAYASPTGCGSAVEPLMGGSREAEPDRYALVSPVARPAAVPTRMIIGTADTIVPRSQADVYRAAAGSVASVAVVEGAGHFDLIAPDGAAWTTLLGALKSLF
jgi:acetyl esterase/lipase